jgi:hypothetical protein
VNLANTLLTQLHLRSKEIAALTVNTNTQIRQQTKPNAKQSFLRGAATGYFISVEVRIDEGGDDDTGLAIHSTEKGIGEFSGCPGHTQSCAAGTIFCFHDFVSTELDAFD